MTIITTENGNRIRLRRKKPGSKPLPEGVKKHRVNICLSPDWYEVGKEKAAKTHASTSKSQYHYAKILQLIQSRQTLHPPQFP